MITSNLLHHKDNRDVNNDKLEIYVKKRDKFTYIRQVKSVQLDMSSFLVILFKEV